MARQTCRGAYGRSARLVAVVFNGHERLDREIEPSILSVIS